MSKVASSPASHPFQTFSDRVSATPIQFDDALAPGLEVFSSASFDEDSSTCSRTIDAGRCLTVSHTHLPVELADALLTFRHFFLVSPKGTGKTTLTCAMIHQVLEQKPDARILLLSCRQAFARNVCSNFKADGLSFGCYLDAADWGGPERKLGNRVIISLQSLHKLASSAKDDDTTSSGMIRPFDVVILDEWETLRRCVCDPTSDKKRMSILMHLSYYLQNASQCWFADADGQRSGWEAMMQLLPSHASPYLVRNVNIYDRRQYIEHRLRTTFEAEIIEHLKRGLNVYVASAQKRWLEALVKQIEDSGEPALMGVHSSMTILHGNLSDVEKKQALTSGTIMDETWSVRFLGITPVATVGVDFSKKHFDVAFIYGAYHCCTAQELMQLSWRVRHLNNNQVHWYVHDAHKKPKEPYPTNLSDILSTFIHYETSLTRLCVPPHAEVWNNESIMAASVDNRVFRHSLTRSPYLLLYSYVVQEKHRCANDFRRELRKCIGQQTNTAFGSGHCMQRYDSYARMRQYMCIESNLPIAATDADVRKKLHHRQRAAEQALNEEQVQKQCAAKVLDDQERQVVQRKRKGCQTEDEQRSMKRTDLERMHRPQQSGVAVDTDYIKHYDTPKMMQRASRFRLLFKGVSWHVVLPEMQKVLAATPSEPLIMSTPVKDALATWMMLGQLEAWFDIPVTSTKAVRVDPRFGASQERLLSFDIPSLLSKSPKKGVLMSVHENTMQQRLGDIRGSSYLRLAQEWPYMEHVLPQTEFSIDTALPTTHQELVNTILRPVCGLFGVQIDHKDKKYRIHLQRWTQSGLLQAIASEQDE